MAFPVGTPYPPGSTQPTPAFAGTFIPEIWSGRLAEKFYASTVLSGIANTNWEGEIRNKGDTVKIRTVPSVTIRDYQADQELVIERPGAPTIDLLIDRGKYFSTALDDVHEIQSDINLLDQWSNDFSESLKVAIDTDVLAAIPGNVDAANAGASAGAISGNINLGASGSPVTITNTPSAGSDADPLDMLVRLGQALDEQNVPPNDRWVVIPAWFAAKLKLSELKDSSIMGDSQSVLRNGRLGMIDRFTVYVSNLLPISNDAVYGGNVTNIFAGHKSGLTFASQFTKLESLRSERSFSTLLRGLKVFGFKIVKPEAIAHGYVAPK